MDLDELVPLLDASTSAAKDRLWDLREDPLYFSHELLKNKEDRHPEALNKPTIKGPPALAERVQDDGLWKVVVATVLSEAALRLEIFSQLQQQAKELQALQATFAIGARVPLPDELPDMYTNCLNTFRALLATTSKMYLAMLTVAGPPSSALRRFFGRCASHPSRCAYHLKQGAAKTKVEKRMLWLLQALCEDGANLSLAGLPFTVDELERLLQADAEAGRMITPHLFELIGELSVISHCLDQVDKHISYARVYVAEGQKRDIDAEVFKRLGPCRSVSYSFQPQKFPEAARVVDPFKRTFRYPILKHRTRENVASLQEAEQNLDGFWKYIIDQNRRTPWHGHRAITAGQEAPRAHTTMDRGNFGRESSGRRGQPRRAPRPRRYFLQPLRRSSHFRRQTV